MLLNVVECAMHASGTNANANCNGKCFGERVFHGGYWVKAAGAAPLTQKLFNI